jgi:hypothetical protein
MSEPEIKIGAEVGPDTKRASQYPVDYKAPFCPLTTKRPIMTDRKDIYKIGAWLDKADWFSNTKKQHPEAHPKVKYFWWFLALLTPVI